MPTPMCPQELEAAPTLKLHRTPNPDAPPHPLSLNTDTSSPKPGDVLPSARGYEILSVVGIGGMGIVYEARHRELNRRVAIKTLRGAVLADPEFRERFRAEAAAIARLQHPNIIQVFEVGTLESLPGEIHPGSFIALEFIEGGSLTQHTHTPQSPREAARAVETLARAAHAAHLLGIIHRDLKPANVLLTRGGEPKIADFGIAKQLESEHTAASRQHTHAGIVLGTPQYMAPEQFKAEKATAAIDVYALGVILYELLTARVPFQGAKFADTMMLALSQDPVPPRRLQPGIPRDLEVICLKCLEKTPGKRYESAAALADDLARWAAGRPVVARPLGQIERTCRWARRNPAVAGLSLAVLLLAVAGVAGIVWNWRAASANARTAEVAATKAETAATKAETAAKQERWERYRVSLVAASSALRLNDVNAARRGLETAPEEHRDWVWNLLYSQLEQSQYVLRSRGTSMAGTRFTPDGRWALVRGDNSYRVWDTRTRTEFELSISNRSPHGVAISPDGSTVAQGTPEHTIVLSDPRDGSVRTVLRGHEGVIGVLWFNRDGTRLTSASDDGTLRAWDTATGRQLNVLRGHTWTSCGLVISPDDSVLAVSLSDSMVHLRDLETGRELAILPRHEAGFLMARFSPTGDRIVTVDGFPSNVIRLWEVRTGKLLATLRGHDNQLHCIRFSPDGTLLASGALDRTVRVWDVSAAHGEPRPLAVLKGHSGWVQDCVFSADGTRLVSASQDKTLRYWDVGNGDQLAVLVGHTDEVHAVSYAADGATIASASADGTIRLWDVRAIEHDHAIKGHEKYVYGAAFHPDGVRVASAAWDGTARIWNATTGRQLLSLDHGKNQIVASCAFHPGGRFLATVARDDSVRVWDADTGQIVHRWRVPTQHWMDTRIAFSPRGDLLASGSHDGRVRIWDVQSRAEVAVLEHGDPIRDVAFSPDGRYLASAGEAGDRTIRIWDVATKQQVQVLRGHVASVYALGWNKAGTLLASGSTDGTVRLWDVATWREVGELNHGIKVYSVTFAPDGKLLATACADNLVRIWDVETRQEVAALRGHSDYVHALAFSPDGTRLVSGSGDKTLRVWDARSPADRVRQEGTAR